MAAKSIVVKSGDTLSGIAEREGVAVSQVTGFRSGNPNLIFPGEVLSIGEISAVTQGPSQPSSKEEVPQFFDNFQNNAFNAFSTVPETRKAPSFEELKSKLAPEGGAPDLINRAEIRETRREEAGVGDLETLINNLTAEEDEVIAARRLRSQGEIDKPVSVGVISGRVGEIERQENERLDAIGRQKSRAVDQLNTATTIIDQFIKDLGDDFSDAASRYDKAFTQNLNIYNAVDEEEDEIVKEARANLQVYTDAVIGGNISYDDLAPDQKAFIQKLEVQSGLGPGFTARLKADNADGEVLTTTTREVGGQKFADSVIRMPDGSMKVVSTSLGGVDPSTGKPGSTEAKAADAEDMSAAIDEIARQNKEIGVSFEGTSKALITTNQADFLKAQWAAQGHTEKDFDDRFGSRVFTVEETFEEE